MCWYCTCHNKMASSVSMNPSDGPRPRSAALLDTQGFKPGETLMIGRRNRSVDSFRRKSLKTEGWENQMLFPSDCVSLIKKNHGCHSRSLKSCGTKLPQTCFRSFEKTARSSGWGWGRMGRKTLPSWKMASVCIWWTVPLPGTDMAPEKAIWRWFSFSRGWLDMSFPKVWYVSSQFPN